MQYTYVWHPRAWPSLKASVREAPLLAITSLTALLSFAESNRAFTFPRQLTGSQLDGSSNTAFISSLYAAMHASTSISSRPSMMAMSLSCQPSLAALQSYHPLTRPCLCRR
jgi:hypothetical protein